MGKAKRRGTYEERVVKAIEKQKHNVLSINKLKIPEKHKSAGPSISSKGLTPLAAAMMMANMLSYTSIPHLPQPKKGKRRKW